MLPRVEDNGRVLRESLVFRYLSTRYDVTVENPRHVSRGVAFVEVDSVVLTGDHSLGLADDRNAHRVRIVLG